MSQNFKSWIIDELRSILTTAVVYFSIDGSGLLNQAFNGDFTKEVMVGLIFVFGRSIIKAVLSVVFPKLFPVRTSVKSTQN